MFLFFLPYDLFITSTDYRIYYYGTSLKEERFSYDLNNPEVIVLNLTNCKVNLHEDYIASNTGGSFGV